MQLKTHPIRFGSGSFTGVTGVMTGTFTKPMPIGEGKFIEPTGKRFALPMATIGHWKGKTMDPRALDATAQPPAATGRRPSAKR
jgi:hypothetical protein